MQILEFKEDKEEKGCGENYLRLKKKKTRMVVYG